MKKMKWQTMLLLLALSMLLIACGGGEEPAAEPEVDTSAEVIDEVEEAEEVVEEPVEEAVDEVQEAEEEMDADDVTETDMSEEEMAEEDMTDEDMAEEEMADEDMAEEVEMTEEEMAMATQEAMIAAQNDAAREFDTVITIWSDNLITPVLLDIATSFQSEYGVGLVIEDVTDRYDQFPIAAPAGEGPDIIMLAHDRIGGYYESGLLAPIDLGDKADMFDATAIQAFTYNGELVGVPYAVENLAFFYNTEMVDAAPETFQEMIDMGAELVDNGDATYALALTGTTYDAFPLQTAFGGYIFGRDADGNYDPTDVGIDSEGMIAAGEFLQENVEAGYISDSTDWDTAHLQFETGEIPFLFAGPWALDRIRTSGVPYAVAQFPSAEQQGQPFLGVQGFSVNALSDNVLLAQAFLTEFLATDEVMAQLQERSNRSSAFNSVTSDDEDLAVFTEIGANASPMPAVPEMGSVWGSWADAFTLIINGEQTAEEALTNGAGQIRDLIDGG